MSSGKRILLISPQPYFEWRGSSIRVKFDALALRNLGYQVDLLTLPIGADTPSLDVNVIRTWNLFGSRSIAIGPSLLKLWFDLVLLIHGFCLIIRNRYAVLHGTEEMGFLCLILSFFSRSKCIYEKHSDSGSYSGGVIKRLVLGLYGLTEKLTIRHADLVICTGPGLMEQARAMGPNSNIVSIPDIPSSILEATPEQINQARAAMQRNASGILATYVGSFAEYQGVDIVFEAIPKVTTLNDTVQFIIIGGSEEEIEHYSKQLADQSAIDNVCFLGKIDPDELPAYLAASDLLLAPRKSGINSPLKLLDYFKAGTAIIATDTVANKRLLNTDNAALCTFDADSFSETIVRLAANREERMRLGQNGHATYKSTYNFSVFRDQLKQAYASLAQ